MRGDNMMLAAFATQHPVLFTILAFPAVVTLCLILLAVFVFVLRRDREQLVQGSPCRGC
jgi:hypothetical protein